MTRSIKVIFSVLVIGGILFFASTGILADLRTSEIKDGTQLDSQILYAKNLLKEAADNQGFSKIDDRTTYTITGADHWRGVMGKMANGWGWNGDKMSLKYSFGDFDGQVEVLEGSKKGFVAGMQSMNYYERSGMDFDTEVKDNKGIVFTLAAFHYFFELAERLSDAPFIRYVGAGQLNGQPMEKVFVSWGNRATKDYDHYVAWIGKESGLIEAITFTTRDNFKPAPGFLYGSLRFDDFRKIDGVLIPFLQTAFIGEPKENTTEFIHQLTVERFEWDVFPISDLRPFKDIAPMGDSKPNGRLFVD